MARPAPRDRAGARIEAGPAVDCGLMTRDREPFWHWPGAAMWRFTFLLGVPFAVWFALIYGGAWFITSLRTLRIPVHMEWERNIPLWPASVLVYESMLVLLHV